MSIHDINYDMSNIQELKVLTENLQRFSDVVERRKPNFIEMNMIKGSAFGFNLLSIPEISVAKFFVSKGAIFPKHYHDEIEYLIVFKGKITVCYMDNNDNITKEITLNVGDCACIKSKQMHTHKSMEDTWAIAITVPREHGFPHHD